MAGKSTKLEMVLALTDRMSDKLKGTSQQAQKATERLKAARSEKNRLNKAMKQLDGFRQLKKTSQSTAASLKKQQDRVAALTREIKQTTGPTKRLTQSRDKAIRQARKLKAQYTGEQQKLETLRRETHRIDGVTGTYAQQQRELARRVAATNKDIKRQEGALTRVARRQKAAANAARQYRRNQARASGMRGAGMRGLATGGAALYGASRVIAPGLEYGEQISELQAVLRLQKDSVKLQQLAAQARDLGSSTQYSASQAAAGQTFLARAGFTPDAIRASMRDVLNLALSGRMDLGRAADIASNISSAFKIDPTVAGNIQHVGDVLTATSTRANVDLEMLGDTMKYLGQAEGLDVSLEQAAAMAGLLGNIGIQGSMAGTTMRAMLTRLSAPTAKARKAMEQLNLTVADGQGNLRDIPDIIADIAQATRDMGNAQRSGYLSDIFGQRAGSGMAELIAQQGTGGITKFTDALKNAAGENARTAATMADNAAGDLKSLKSAWDEVGISITDVNNGPLRELIQNVTELLRNMGDWIKANPKLAADIAKLGTGLAALVAVGGALVLTLGSILGPIALVKYALVSLNAVALLNPITLAIGLLAGAAYLIYRNWGDISEFFKDRWNDIKTAFSGGVGAVAKLLLNWNPFGLIYRGITAALEKLGIQIPDQFKTLGSAIVDGIIGGIKDKYDALKNAVTGMGGATVGWLKDKLGIHSPSRVFHALGDNTVEGYRQGIAARQGSAIQQIDQFARRLARAGAGIALGASMAPALAHAGGALPAQQPIAFDNRPPIQSSAGGRGDVHIRIGDINVTPAPGMDEHALARLVEQRVTAALERAAADQAARSRSALYDRE